MKLTRRNLITTAAKGSALWLLGPQLARLSFAQQAVGPSRFLVHIRTQGGMDTTLGLDPLTHADFGTNNSHVFIEYTPDQILNLGGLRLGPAAASLKEFKDSISVIRGIHMRQDIQHEPMNEFWVRASLSNSGSAFMCNLAERMGTNVLSTKRIPNLTAVPQISLVDSSSELKSLTAEEWASIVAGGNNVEREQTAKLSQSLNDSRSKAVDVGEGADRALKSAALAAAYMADSLAGMAVIDVDRDANSMESMDSHSAHEKIHLRIQTSIWDTVAQIFRLYKATQFGQGSLFDATTFIVTSEFSRTPYLNAGAGKDHNIHTNSVLVCGPSIRAGKAAGSSRIIASKMPMSSSHVACPFDFSSGRALTLSEIKTLNFKTNKDVALLFPEDIMATVTHAAFGGYANGLIKGQLIKSLL